MAGLDDTSVLIACSRLYNVTPAVESAWAQVFEWAARESGVELRVFDYPAPKPLDALWRRSDMGAVFMCGWPFRQARERRLIAVAAPVPSPARYGGRPVYMTDLVVHRDAPFQRLEDTFGGRVAWTHETSHSGFNAMRHHLLRFRTPSRAALYSESVGPLITPAAAIAAVAAGRADVAPVDGYVFDLLMRNDPGRLADVRVIATTEPTPIPLLVASPHQSGAADAIRSALVRAHREPSLVPVRDALLLHRFIAVTVDAYGVMQTRADEAEATGYRRPS